MIKMNKGRHLKIMKDKLPKINLTSKEIEEIFKDKKLEDFFPKKKKTCNCSPYRCDLCQDTKIVLVYGGPNRECPACGPKC